MPRMTRPRRRRLAWFRRPVRREDAERYLSLTLVSFAATVIVTRWFLQLTGFPKIGGGDLHIAHALFGGVLLFVAALLPIVLAGRSVYLLAAVVSGVGIGLFIDEVGKFITAQNDYFTPAAAPIIYATFLLAAVVWLRLRRPEAADPRTSLLGALELLEESVEGDLQPRERDELLEKLRAGLAAHGPEQRRLADTLLEFIDSRSLVVVADQPAPLERLRGWWAARRDRWLGGRGLRMAIVAALLVSGGSAIVALLGIGGDVGTATVPVSSRVFGLTIVHLVVEGIAGVLLVAGAVLVGAVGRHRLGWTLAYFGLLVVLVLGDLVSFYVRQFDSIFAVLLHVLLLGAVVEYRQELASERGAGVSRAT
jgi:hypothetical protein